MRALLIGLATLVVLLIAAVLIVPSFIDWNGQKALITEEARKFTGRTLVIDGDVSLSLLPAPALSAESVRLANIEGGSAPAMAELESLEVQVALMPLLRGRVQVQSVVLVQPRILLEVLPDGRRNWDFTPSDQSESEGTAAGQETGQGQEQAAGQPQDAASDGGGDFVVQVDSFAIQDGTLIYRDAVDGREEQVESLDGSLVAESLQGPFIVEGSAIARGVEGGVKLTVGRLVESGATPINLELALPRSASNLAFSGSLSFDPTPVGLRGRLKGEGEDLGGLIADLVPEQRESLPSFLHNSFTLDAEVTADREVATIGGVTLGLGTTSLTGEATARIGPPHDVGIKLAVSRLDLDKLLAAASPRDPSDAEEADSAATAASDAAEGDGAGESGGGAAASGAAQPPGLVLPDDITGNLTVAVDALVYRRQVVRQIRLNASLGDGQIAVNQALALLPGGSDLSITGSVTGGEVGPRFTGHVEAAADNLRGILDWLGADVSRVPADRLRKMSYASRVEATPQQISLSDIDLRVDVSHLAGGVVIAVRERLGLGIGLSLDNVNVDAYLPVAASVAADAETADEGDTQPAPSAEEEKEDATDSAASGDVPAMADLGPLDRFDANVNLRVANAKWRGQTIRSVRLEGTLQQGKLTLREASVADLAGSSLRYAGEIAELGTMPAVDGLLELSVADPLRLAKLGGFDSTTLERIGPFSLTANLRGPLSNLGFNSKVAALDGRFGFAGVVALLSAAPRFDIAVEAEHPDPAVLAARLGGSQDVPSSLGALKAKAQVAGTPQEVQVSGLDGRIGPVSLAGAVALTLADEPKLSAADLTIAVKHPELADLAKVLGAGDSLSAGLGGIDVRGKLQGAEGQMALREISGSVGPMSLAGAIEASLAGPDPALTAVNLNLHLRHPSLARLSAALGGPSVDPQLGGVDITGNVSGGGDEIQAKDIKGSLGGTQLSGTASVDMRGAKPKVTADLSTGELPISRLFAAASQAQGPGGASGGASGGAGSTGGGSVSPRWSRDPLDLSALQTFDADLSIKSNALLLDRLRMENSDLRAALTDGRIDLERFVATLYEGSLRVTGTATTGDGMAADFTVTANEVQIGDLLRANAGFDRVSGPISLSADLKTRGGSEADLVSGLTGAGKVSGEVLVTAKAEEQLGAALLGVLGDKVKEVRGLTDTTNTLFNAFAGAPAELTGSFSVEQGVLRTVDTRLQGRNAYALTHGNANLPGWVLNSRTDVFRSGDGETPYLTASLSGPLDEPNVRIGGLPLQRAPQSQEPSSGGGAAQDSGQPQTIEPEDLIRGLIKGLSN